MVWDAKQSITQWWHGHGGLLQQHLLDSTNYALKDPAGL